MSSLAIRIAAQMCVVPGAKPRAGLSSGWSRSARDRTSASGSGAFAMGLGLARLLDPWPDFLEREARKMELETYMFRYIEMHDLFVK